MNWQNWSGRHGSEVADLRFVRSEADAAALVARCHEQGTTVRVAGAGHSHSPVVLHNETIIDMSGLAGVLSVDTDAQQAWIRAGSSIYSLGAELHRHGLCLRNQGDIDRQLLGGVVATGTHGTGRDLQNISAAVQALTVILADGSVVNCSKTQAPDLFEVARLSVGSVGLVSGFKMQLTPSVVLQETGARMMFDEIFSQIEQLVADNERFEFFWYPGSDEAIVKRINPVTEAPVYPLAEEGQRQAYSFEVLPNHRPVKHTEMEYSVPLVDGPACFEEIRSLIVSRFPDVRWPVEYRTVAEDDIWLSMASGRPTVTISVHQDIREDEEPYYRACEEIFMKYGGRPHWGKVNYLDNTAFASCYPRWEDWWRARDKYDPAGTFLNDYMRGIRS